MLRSPVRAVLFVLVTVLSLGFGAQDTFAQLSLSLGNPDVSQFPIVQIGVWVTENGKPATLISSGNFNVKEDGIPGNVLGLTDCGGTSSAAIAFVVDTSQSMEPIVGSDTGTKRNYRRFFTSFSQFLNSLPGPSLLALIPFGDGVGRWYPGTPANFWNSSVVADSQNFMFRLNGLTFRGGTNVDAGLAKGISVLAASTLPHRSIILVTDGNTTDEAGEIANLTKNNIALYVVDVSHDPRVDSANLSVAEASGGAYFKAPDSLSYGGAFDKIAKLIFAEHCTLLYQSNAPCPSWKDHTVEVTANYRGNVTTTITHYLLGRNLHDSLAPRFALDTSNFLSRKLRSFDYFPCESGMLSLKDSALINFRRLNPTRVNSDSAIDSIVVIDSLHAADAYYLAKDSSGNTSRFHIHYEPRPDTVRPRLSSMTWNGAGHLIDTITEVQPWDRGVEKVFLAAGSTNFALDSVVFTNGRFVRAYLRVSDIRDSGQACLAAIDSAGNRRDACISWYGEGTDTLPPLFTQDPLAVPRIQLTGFVTEKRLHDRGLQTITITPVINVSTPVVSFTSPQEATVGVTLLDSLHAGLAIVDSYDSIGNHSRGSLRYDPSRDTLAPAITYTTPTISSFLFTATETRNWDRGVETLTLLPTSTNATASVATWTDGAHASLTITIVDRTKDATLNIRSTDSAGNISNVAVTFHGIPLTMLGDVTIDYGRVPAPAVIQRSVTLSSSNDIPFDAQLIPVSGNDSIFSFIGTTPVAFSESGSQTLNFEFHPNLVGYWSEKYILKRDTATLSTITLKGQSYATLKLALDTASVERPGVNGVLTLSVDAVPKPVNLDTISFRLVYDQNVIRPLDFESCSDADTTICLYTGKWEGPEGNKTGLLVRKTGARSATLHLGSSLVRIPFTTYLSVHDTTVVRIEPNDTSLAVLSSTQDGLVLVGAACGDDVIRTALAGHISVKIGHVSPNPASSTIELSIVGAAATKATVQLIAIDGTVVRDISLDIVRGTNITSIPIGGLSSGTYELIVRENGLHADRARIEIVH